MKTQNKIEVNQAKNLVDRIGDHIDSRYDMTYDPIFPKTRNDVCAVRRMTENGSTYGYDTIYLLWNNGGKEIKYEGLINSKSSKDYLNIEDVVETEKDIIVNVFTGGSFGGKPWKESIKRSKYNLGLK